MRLYKNSQLTLFVLLKIFTNKNAFLSNAHRTSMRVKKHQLDVRQNGRSMMEMLGVLAIVGILTILGIWSYSSAMSRYRVNKTISQMAEITYNIRDFLYIYGNNYKEMNNLTAIQYGLVPENMITNRSMGTIKNVYGGDVVISGTDGDFSIEFLNISDDALIKISTADWGLDDPNYIGMLANE